MTLPETDLLYLADKQINYEISADPGGPCLVIRDWPLPSGYTENSTTLLVRIPSMYPDMNPDMWWFDPAVRRIDGRTIPATEATETYLGRSWQRWSRHLSPEQWRSGIDGLESYLSLVTTELAKSSEVRAT